MGDLYELVEDKYADSDGVRIHYVAIGSEDAPLIVMIHGFPDFWYTWRLQMEVLKDAYRVVAVDLRGYNLSDQPEGVDNYAMPLLVGDIAAVIAAEGRESAIVVGHDWGGVISWNLAMTRPELVNHLIILNLPHPAGLAREIQNNPDQRRNSAYAFNFQKPEAAKSLNAIGLTFWVRDMEARKRYVEAFQRSSFEGMLNYYKANYPRVEQLDSAESDGAGLVQPDFPKVKVPVLMFHGLDDSALLPGALSGTWEWLEKDLTLVTIPGADHFVQQDAPDMVNNVMRDWLARQLASD